MAGGYDGTIRINTKLDNRGFSQGVSQMRGSINSVIGSIKGLTAALGVGLSIAGLVKVGKQAIDLASDLQEVQNVVDTAFKSMSYKMEEFADTCIEQFGLSKLSAKEMGSTFMAMASNMVPSMEQASDMAVELTGRAADMASFYNKTASETATALNSIFTGETETLKQYGVVMTEANLQQYAYRQGIKKTLSDMTQAEKVQLRYNYVMEQTSLAAGDFAKTSDSWANQTRILSEQFKELLSVLGAGLIQVLTPAVKGLNAILSKLIDVANALGTIMSKLLGLNSVKLSSSGQSAADGFSAATDSVEGYTDAVNKASKASKGAVADFDELTMINSKSPANSDSLDFGITGLKVEELNATETGISEIEKQFTQLLDVLDPTKKALKELWNEGLSQLLDFSFDTLKEFFDDFLVPFGKWSLSEKGLPRFLKITNSLLNNINWNKLRNSLDKLYKVLSKLAICTFDSLLDFYESFFAPVVSWEINEVFTTLLNLFIAFANKIDWEQINDSLNSLWTCLAKFVIGIGQGLLDVFEFFAGIALNAIAEAINIVAIALEFLFDVIQMIPVETLKMIGAAIGGLLAGIIAYEGATAIINRFAAAWNTFTSAISNGITILASNPYIAIAAGIGAIVASLYEITKITEEKRNIEDYGVVLDDFCKKVSETSQRIKDRASVASDYTNGSGMAELALAKELTDRYYELAEKENLTVEEKQELVSLANQLKDVLPDVSGVIDEETGLITAQKDEVEKLIQAKLQEYKLEALKDDYIEKYKLQREAEENLAEATEKCAEAQSKVNADRKIFEETGNNIDYVEAISDWDKLNTCLGEAQEAYDAVTDSMQKLSDEMVSIGTNTSDGFLKGYDSGKMVTSVRQSSQELSDAFAEELGIHSPSKVFEEFGQYTAEGFVNGYENSGLIQIIRDSATQIMESFSSIVSFDAWSNIFGNMSSGFQLKWIEFSLLWNESLTNWWNSDVSSWFTVDKWMGIFSNIFTAAKSKWNELEKWWNTSTLCVWLKDDVAPWFTIEKWEDTLGGMLIGFDNIWTNIRQNAKEHINDYISMIENFFNWIISGINSLIDKINTLSFDIPAIPGVTDGVSVGFNIPNLGNISIPRLATGTVVPPGMSQFLAVLGDNNKETEVVSPLSTMKEALMEAIMEMGGIGQNGDIVINIDGKEVFRVVRDQNREYKKMTGQSAFV